MSALGFQQSSGADIEPFVKYNAKAGRWFRVDRTQGNDGWQTNDVDITANATFVIDLANIEVGWIDFTANGPNVAMSPVGESQPERPSAKHRQGFRTHLFSERNLGGKRVWTHNAKCVLSVIDDLYAKYLAAPESQQGLLPVISMTSSKPITTPARNNSPASTSYAPVFDIVQWVPSPFDAAPAAQQGAQAQQQATAYVAPQASQNVTNGAAPLF